MDGDFMCTEVLVRVSNWIWGFPMLGLVIFTGLFLTFRLSFPQIRLFPKMIKHTILGLFHRTEGESRDPGISPLQAVANALGGTIGTGSIAGVATALTLGGPGAIFWMWVASFLGMAIKYCEIFLAILYQKKEKNGERLGGPMYYISRGLGTRIPAILFSVFALLCTFGIGNLTQSQTIVAVAGSLWNLRSGFFAAVLTLLCAVVLLGGVRRISRVNAKLVPFMSLLYLLMCFVVILIRLDRLPFAISAIFREAFRLRCAGAGFLGGGIASAVRSGFSKGIFSSEAGLGSAPIAHGAGKTDDAATHSLWGIFEVFVSSVLICTFSALVVLTGRSFESTGLDGAPLMIASFRESLPYLGPLAVGLSSILFSFSSILGWSYYGEVCIRFFARKSKAWILLYRVAFLAIVFLGGVSTARVAWSLSEILNALMALPNLVALIFLSKKVASTGKGQKSFGKNGKYRETLAKK